MNLPEVGTPSANSPLREEIYKLKEKFGSWSAFEKAIDVNHSVIIRMLNREITLTPNVAYKLALHSRRTARGWMQLWVDHWYQV